MGEFVSVKLNRDELCRSLDSIRGLCESSVKLLSTGAPAPLLDPVLGMLLNALEGQVQMMRSGSVTAKTVTKALGDALICVKLSEVVENAAKRDQARRN